MRSAVHSRKHATFSCECFIHGSDRHLKFKAENDVISVFIICDTTEENLQKEANGDVGSLDWLFCTCLF
jgi:hypothetical protein